MLETLEESESTTEVEDDLPEFIQEGRRRQAHRDEIESELISLAGQMNAVDYLFIKKLGEFDEHDGWHGEGIRSFAHYLNWKIGMGTVIAREKVRVARALPDLPLIDTAFAKGEVSYSKVRAMTRVATPENEAYLMQIAEYGTAAHIELLVRKFEYCERLEEPDPYEDWKRYKSLQWYQDETGMFVFNGRLPPEEGAVIVKALEIHCDKMRQLRLQREQGNEANKGEEVSSEAKTAPESKDEVKVDSNNVSAETFSQQSLEKL